LKMTITINPTSRPRVCKTGMRNFSFHLRSAKS